MKELLEEIKIKKFPARSYEFSRKMRTETIAELDRCYQCSMCSNGCPVAYAMDFYPHQLIHMVHLGLKEEVLQSRAIWLCTSCETCAARCPNQVDIVHFMDTLRQQSIREKFKSSVNEIPQFHEIFMREIQRRGGINELHLLLHYRLKTGALSSLKNIRQDASLGLKMFLKGKFKLFSRKIRRPEVMKKVFHKAIHN